MGFSMLSFERFSQKGWLVLLIATNTSFYMLLSIAGTAAGRIGFMPTGTGSIRLRTLYILNVSSEDYISCRLHFSADEYSDPQSRICSRQH
jgi:hypothetical protein